MLTDLVSIPTDTVPLDGALYRPDSGRPRGAILLMHGNTMNFYVGMPRFLPPYLTAEGYVCLAYNRRGHDILGIRDSRAAEGGAFQTFAEAIADNDAATGYLVDQGYAEPLVFGHSLGGLLAGHHAAHHPQIRGLVLLSAIVGGAGGLGRDSESGYLAGERSEQAMAAAEELVAEGRGKELMLLPGWWYAISAESFLDRLRNRPSLLDSAPDVTCPSLFVRGDQERSAGDAAARFQERAAGPCEVAVVPDCGHFYTGREDAVAEVVVGWLRRTFT